MKIKIFILILLVFLLTGCWNYRELDDMSIVGAVGIDYNTETKLFEVSVQIFKAKKTSTSVTAAGSSDESPIIIYEDTGKTIHEILRNMITTAPKKVYIGHIDAIIIGKETAENYLIESLDFFFRDPESRKDFDILVSYDKKASEILKIITPLNNVTSSDIKDIIESNSKYKAIVTSITYDKFVSMIFQEGLEAVVPAISIKGNEVEKGETTENTKSSVSSADIEISKLAVFKEDKYLGILNEEESFGYNLLSGNVKETVFSFPCEENAYASIEIIKSKTDIEVSLNKKNIPKAKIKINIEAANSENNCAINIMEKEGIDKIVKLAKKELNKYISLTMNKIQKTYNSDILGFGEYLFRNENKYWKKNGKEWYKIFPNIEYGVEIEIKISKKGSTLNTLKENYNDKKK